MGTHEDPTRSLRTSPTRLRSWADVWSANANGLATDASVPADIVAFSLPPGWVRRGLSGRVHLWEWPAQSGAPLASGRDLARSPFADVSTPLVDLSPDHLRHPDAAHLGTRHAWVAAPGQLAQRYA